MGNAVSTLNPLPGTIPIPYPPGEGQAHKNSEVCGVCGRPWEGLLQRAGVLTLPINDLLVPSPTLASRGGGLELSPKGDHDSTRPGCSLPI